MHFEYLEQSEARLSLMAFEDASLEVQMGTGEGAIGIGQQLTFVVKVFEGFQQNGIGFVFFNKI